MYGYVLTAGILSEQSYVDAPSYWSVPSTERHVQITGGPRCNMADSKGDGRVLLPGDVSTAGRLGNAGLFYRCAIAEYPATAQSSR